MNAHAAARVALLAVALGACGGTNAPAPGTGEWPMTLEVPGVLGYVAARVTTGMLAEASAQLLAFEPEGLGGDGPLLLVLLDPSVYGGRQALALPVADEAAWLASMQAAAAWTALGEGRYRLDVEPGHPLALLHAASQGLVTGGAGVAGGLLAALRGTGGLSLTAHVVPQSGHILLAPSFEGVGACRSALRLLAAAPARRYVASLDLARVQAAYREPIRGAINQLRAALTGARGLGLAYLMAGHAQGGGSPAAGGRARPPLRWDRIAVLAEMLGLQEVEAVQVLSSAGGAVGEDLGGEHAEQELTDRLARDFRHFLPDRFAVRFAEGSVRASLLATMVPAPRVAGAVLVAARDPVAFPLAMAEVVRPLAEHLHGRGAPAQAWMDGLAQLLSAWGGTLAVFDDPSGAVAALAPGREVDFQAWASWLEPALTIFEGLLARLPGAEDQPGGPGELTFTPQKNGRLLVTDARGKVWLTLGRHEDTLWLLPGEAHAAPMELYQRLAGSVTVERGPATLFRPDPAWGEDWPRAGLQAEGRRLLLDITWPRPRSAER